jgi:hypothetical protein
MNAVPMMEAREHFLPHFLSADHPPQSVAGSFLNPIPSTVCGRRGRPFLLLFFPFYPVSTFPFSATAAAVFFLAYCFGLLFFPFFTFAHNEECHPQQQQLAASNHTSPPQATTNSAADGR